MIVRLADLLGPDDIRHCREVLQAADWVDGRATAGEQSSLGKRNLQLPETGAQARALGERVMAALSRSAAFASAALPARVFPPLFNRYDVGMGFSAHIDNAVRFSPLSGARYRTDLSCTLFLSEPDEYAGGELMIGEGPDAQPVKLAAGDLVLYPATTVHRVEPVTRGARCACFFWVQSMVRDAGRRALLYDMDQAIAQARGALGDHHPAAISLTGAYHNLIRMWAEV